MEILCKLGFHKWELEYSNIFEPPIAIFRTYQKCVKCSKWGKLVYFKEFDAEKVKLLAQP